MSAAANAFLGGARSRLLPAWTTLRFFAAAAVFHLLAWLALAAGAMHWIGFAGGLGWPLAALHLLTLGVFGTAALGAGAQLVPVATRRAAPGHRLLTAIWWIYTPAVALLVLGMGLPRPSWLAAGALAVALCLAAWGVLMARNLRGGLGMRGVLAHGWTALASLAVLLGSALSLAATWLGLAAPARGTAVALHLVFAPFGFMGLLALGLSAILVPMFALAEAPRERDQLASCGLGAAALLLAGAAALGVAPTGLRLAAIALAALAVALHLRSMRQALRTGMRQALGRSFVLVKVGWGGLAASLAVALAMVLELPVPRLEAWFGLCVIGVWLLSFVLGMLQRILPFLAAMHAAGAGRRAPTPSSLTHERALAIHFRCHLAALAGLGAAIALDSAWLAALAAAVGAAGAAAFCWFAAVVLGRLAQKTRTLS